MSRGSREGALGMRKCFTLPDERDLSSAWQFVRDGRDSSLNISLTI